MILQYDRIFISLEPLKRDDWCFVLQKSARDMVKPSASQLSVIDSP